MDYSHLVAEFAARKGITKVPTGKRAYTETIMSRMEGWEPTQVPVFNVMLQGEDGMEWTEGISAETEQLAAMKARKMFPESRVLSVTR